MKWIIAYANNPRYVDTVQHVQTHILECDGYPTWEDLKFINPVLYGTTNMLISISQYPERKKEKTNE